MGLTQKKLANYFHVDQTTISKWEKGISHPDFETGKKLSLFFGVPLSRIYQSEDAFDYTYLPIYQNLYPSQFDTDTFEINSHLYIGDNFFSANSNELLFREDSEDNPDFSKDYYAFIVESDNLQPHFLKGDIAIIKRSSEAETGDIVVVSIEGEAARLAFYKAHSNGVSLTFKKPDIPEFWTISQVNAGDVRILGTVFELRRRYSSKITLE